jgi:hypothetical protein
MLAAWSIASRCPRIPLAFPFATSRRRGRPMDAGLARRVPGRDR